MDFNNDKLEEPDNLAVWDMSSSPIKDLWKNDSIEFKRFCGQLLTNQARLLSRLSEYQVDIFLKKYNFKDVEDALRNVYKFAKVNWNIHNDSIVALKTAKDDISYKKDDGNEYYYRPRIRPISFKDDYSISLDYFLEGSSMASTDVKDYRIMVLYPFNVLSDTNASWYGDWVILKKNA